MFADFTVFPSKQAASIVNRIDTQGYYAYFSNDASLGWLEERLINPKRYRLFYEGDIIDEVGKRPLEPPLLAIKTLEDYDDWDRVCDWVCATILSDGVVTAPMQFFERPTRLKLESNIPGEERLVDGIKSHVLSIPPDPIDLKSGYEFDSYYDEALDTKYYSVIAPSSEVPFTVVVYHFSCKDDSYFFSDIYASSAWAANRLDCRYDFTFLQQLWKHLGLPGEFTMDVVKRRVDACYPDRVTDPDDLEPEPSVYRRSMADVMKMKRKRT